MNGRAMGWGAAAGALAAAALALPMERSLDRLASARAERHQLRAAAEAERGETWAMASNLMVAGPDPGAALARYVRGLATRDGVLVERLATRSQGPLVHLTLQASGSAGAVLRFADTLERERPLVRFAQWSLQRSGDAIRLQGEAVAPWRG